MKLNQWRDEVTSCGDSFRSVSCEASGKGFRQISHEPSIAESVPLRALGIPEATAKYSC